MRAPLALGFALAIGGCLLACSGSTDSDESSAEPEIEDVDAKADGTTFPLGTYLADDETDSIDHIHVASLTLKSDKTFYRTDAGLPEGDQSSTSGTFAFYKTSTGKKAIRFYGDDAAIYDTLYYSLKGSKLTVRFSPASTYVSKLVRAGQRESMCGVPDDCSLQGLKTPSCSEKWTCSYQSTCLSCVSPEWIQSVMDAYTLNGTSSLTELRQSELPSAAQSWLDEDRARLGSNSSYQPENTHAFELSLDGRDSYVIEAEDTYMRHVEIFDTSGQHIASGSSEAQSDVIWKSSTPL